MWAMTHGGLSSAQLLTSPNQIFGVHADQPGCLRDIVSAVAHSALNSWLL